MESVAVGDDKRMAFPPADELAPLRLTMFANRRKRGLARDEVTGYVWGKCGLGREPSTTGDRFVGYLRYCGRVIAPGGKGGCT